MASGFQIPFTYTVYNDFSTEENTAKLQEASGRLGFELVNLVEITEHPSPNYLLVLQMAQQRAIEADAGLIIVESDVVVKKIHYRLCLTEQWKERTVGLQLL